MKKIFSILFLASVMLFATSSYAQNSNTAKLNTPNTALKKVYDPSRDAMKDIYQAIDEAKSTGRNVLCQVGGNWCPWCLKFADYAQRDTAIRNYMSLLLSMIRVNLFIFKIHPISKRTKAIIKRKFSNSLPIGPPRPSVQLSSLPSLH